MKKLILLCCAVVVTGCSPRPDLEAERMAILKADSAWLAAARAANVDSTLSFWTDDARVISPGQPPLIGHAAIRTMLTEGFATPGFAVSWHTSEVVVAPSGDVAYSFGTNMFTVPGPEGRIDTLRGQGVVIWRKGPDGRWRSSVDTWTPQAP
jgi:ketosteroid isomerase-like protein